MDIEMNVSSIDFGTLAVCAVRYCYGRASYMPESVQKIVLANLDKIPDHHLQVMIDDCEYNEKFGLLGDGLREKYKWPDWHEKLIQEQKRRKDK